MGIAKDKEIKTKSFITERSSAGDQDTDAYVYWNLFESRLQHNKMQRHGEALKPTCGGLQRNCWDITADFGINSLAPSCSWLYPPGCFISYRSPPRTFNTTARAKFSSRGNSLQQELTHFTTSAWIDKNKASPAENNRVLQEKESVIVISDSHSPKWDRNVLRCSRGYARVLI